MPSRYVVGVREDPRAPGASRVESVLVALLILLLAGALIGATVFFPAFWPLTCGIAFGVTVLAVVGRERMVVLVMLAVFATAPMYKGIAASPSAPITPTDMLLGVAVLLAAPTLITRRANLPFPYVIGLVVVLVVGFVASLLSIAPAESLLNLVQWTYVLAILPIFYVMWRPSGRVVRALVWGYVGGHLVSTGWAIIDGPLTNDRYLGLAHHPNAFAIGGMMSVAGLLYLWSEHRSALARAGIAVAGLLCLWSVLASGSRASTLVIAGLILMIPFVERSALQGFTLAGLGALAVLSLPILADLAGEGSALARLTGAGDAGLADRERDAARESGFELFFEQPLIGHGFLDANLILHDNLLEVAVAAGIFGLLGYLVMMFTLARPIIGFGRYRRLCYFVWAYLGVGAAIPSLWDLAIWVPMTLAFLAAVEPQTADRPADATDEGAPRPTAGPLRGPITSLPRG